MGDNAPVKHVDDAGQEKMAPFTSHIPILNVQLPELVGAVHNTIVSYLFGYGIRPLPLRSEDAQLFAKPVYFFLVND